MIFVSPTFVDIPRKTKNSRRIYLNLNVYRNLNFILNNQSKVIYNKLMGPQVKDVKIVPLSTFEYKLFRKDSKRCDKSNTLCIVEKFFCDCLVSHGCLEDDSEKFIGPVSYIFGGVDKENPRVEITINSPVGPLAGSPHPPPPGAGDF